jgi:DNA polymerase-1
MTQPEWLRKAAARVAEQIPDATPMDDVVPGRTVMVDGDYLCYFASGGDEMRVDISRRVFVDRLHAVRELTGAEKVELHLSARASTKGERYLIATTQPYQGHRHGRKPKNWEAVREFAETVDEDRMRAKRIEWWDREADDGLAAATLSARDPVTSYVIHTADKDMRMLPGLHLAWTDYARTEVPKGAYEVIGPYDGKVYGTKWFWMQMLMGDTADHIPGLWKVGEGKALKWLAGTTCNAEAYEVVTAKYQEFKGETWADYFVEQAELLWLRKTAEPHDYMRVLPSNYSRDIYHATVRMKRNIKEKREALDRLNAQT